MILHTERLVLRPFCERDAEAMLGYLSPPVVNCFADMALTTLEEARQAALERSRDGEYDLAICLKGSDKVIGEILAGPDPHLRDTYAPCWMLNASCQGHGYAYEAAWNFFDYLFQVKGARRIFAYTEDYNLASQKLCEKLGMRREGLFLEYVSFVNGPDGAPIYENTYQYAILKREWDLRRQADGAAESDAAHPACRGTR